MLKRPLSLACTQDTWLNFHHLILFVVGSSFLHSLDIPSGMAHVRGTILLLADSSHSRDYQVQIPPHTNGRIREYFLKTFYSNYLSNEKN